MGCAHLAKAASALLVLMLAACASAVDGLPPAPATTDIADYRLGPTDRLQVTVFGEPALSGELTVDSLGNVTVPFVGEVAAKDRTVREVQAEIVAKLRALEILRDPQVSVAIVSYRPFFVLGEVRTPGAFPYAAGTTVQRAVAQAGGYSYRADREAILITREADGQNYRAQPATPVLPGDTIEVMERFF